MESAGKRTPKAPIRFGTEDHFKSVRQIEEENRLRATLRKNPKNMATTDSVEAHITEALGPITERIAKFEKNFEDMKKLMKKSLESIESVKKDYLTLGERISQIESNVTTVRDQLQEGTQKTNQLFSNSKYIDDRIGLLEQDIDKCKLMEKQINLNSEKCISISNQLEDSQIDLKLMKVSLSNLSNNTTSSNGHPSLPQLENHSTTYMSNTTLPSSNTTYNSVCAINEKFHDVIPEYSGGYNGVHPEQFLTQIDGYFSNGMYCEQQKLNLISRRLTHDARIWYDAIIPSPSNYEEFKTVFRHRFWSKAIQQRIHMEIMQPYQYYGNQGWSNHAMQWIAKAKYLSPPIEQSQLVTAIIQHFPSNICTAILGRGPKTTSELLDILSEFENSPSFHQLRNPNTSYQSNNQSGPRYNENNRSNNNYNRHNRQNWNNTNSSNGNNRNQSNNQANTGNDDGPAHQG